MLVFNDFIKTETGKIIISCILGFGLASLFRKVCNDNNCMIIYSPPTESISNKIFKHGDSCYTYTQKDTKCAAKDISKNK